jgi:hypothetical protein
LVGVIGIYCKWQVANSIVSSLVLAYPSFFVGAAVVAPEVASCGVAVVPVVAVGSKKPNLTGVVDEIVVVERVV